MKVTWRTMGSIGLFVLPFAVVYWWLSDEESGTVLLFAVAAAMLVLAVYLRQAHRDDPTRPEDQPDGVAPPEDVLGRFSSASIWPFALGIGATLAAFGLAFSGWLALSGLGVMAFALAGLASESEPPQTPRRPPPR